MACMLQVRPWTRFVEQQANTPFAPESLSIRSSLYAGDALTVQNQVALSCAPGDYAVSVLDEEDGWAYVFLYLPGVKPVSWRNLGIVAVDTATGCFTTREAAEAIKALNATDDELLDEVEDICDEDGAGTLHIGGHPMFVFQLVGDGTYNVAEGIDESGRTCVAIFGTLRNDWEDGDELG